MPRLSLGLGFGKMAIGVYTNTTDKVLIDILCLRFSGEHFVTSKKYKYNHDRWQDGKGKPLTKYKDLRGRNKMYLEISLDCLGDTSDDREGNDALVLLNNTGSTPLH
jgi:hypothetical protein